MALKIYNTLSRKKELFEPLYDNRVHMYVCGPTVYDYPHIGHAKSYVSFDVIVRYLRYLQYKVRYVQNITDVGHLLDTGEDRILRGAAKENVEPMELVERYTRAYFEAMDALNVLRPDISPHAAAHIPEQIELVKTLLKNGYAYEVNGSVYFDVAKWKEYGKLSGRKIEEQQAGARVQVNEEKRNPADFALWKKAPENHIMKWNSPWGEGYPGWHAECSAMAMKYLGETIDIHGGGMENQFPHHDCEIAQSEAATGKPFARYWIHNNMVLVDGVKMSKSLGNFTTVAEALEKFTGNQIRFFILSSHYRSPVDFTDQAVEASGQGLQRLILTRRNLEEYLEKSKAGPVSKIIDKMAGDYHTRFLAAMDDDFNTPAAIAVLFDYTRDINKVLQKSPAKESVERLYKDFITFSGDVLGIGTEQKSRHQEAGPFIELLIRLRRQFRSRKDWEMSDYIRDQLQEQGIVLEDGKAETTWRFEK